MKPRPARSFRRRGSLSLMTATERGPSWLVRAAVLGLVAGFLGGLFGVGGGILIVPALVLVMHMDQRLAHGTSLAAVLPIAVASLIGYTLEGKVDWPVGVLLAIGAVGGAVIGTHILHVLPQRVLGYVFAGFLLLTAVRLVADHSSALGRSDLTVGRGALLVLIGVITGILAGLLGVGGGIVMVPAMIVLFGIPAVVAKGTSLAVIVPTAIMGTWRNRTKHNTDLRVAAVVGMAGIAVRVRGLAGVRRAVRGDIQRALRPPARGRGRADAVPAPLHATAEAGHGPGRRRRGRRGLTDATGALPDGAQPGEASSKDQSGRFRACRSS